MANRLNTRSLTVAVYRGERPFISCPRVADCLRREFECLDLFISQVWLGENNNKGTPFPLFRLDIPQIAISLDPDANRDRLAPSKRMNE